MIFIGTPIFTRQAKELLDDDDYIALQKLRVLNPSAGDVIEGTGGIRKGTRKTRWSSSDLLPFCLDDAYRCFQPEGFDVFLKRRAKGRGDKVPLTIGMLYQAIKAQRWDTPELEGIGPNA